MRGTLSALALLGALVFASPALSAAVRECDGATEGAYNIVEPWEANSRTFYQGRVRVAFLDTGGEPACCSGHLLVIFYADDNPESFTCRLVSESDGRGFAGIDFKGLRSSYDPARGLLLTFGYSAYPVDGGFDAGPTRGVARVRINIPAGAVTVE
ncbi:MAG: hypothetical protein Q8L23_14870 [Caulobacter sp.]|nr:hypothetical protein [Caulobacter sp.]